MSKYVESAAKHVAEGLPWKALVELGAVLASVEQLQGGVRRRTQELGRRLAPEISAIRLEAKRSYDRLQHLAGFAGNAFEVEEVVLMLTLRIELALAALASHELIGLDLTLDLEGIDQGLKAVACAAISRTAYRRSISLVEKNWRREIPFDVDRLGISELWSAAPKGTA